MNQKEKVMEVISNIMPFDVSKKTAGELVDLILEVIEDTDHQEIKDTLQYIKEAVAEILGEIKK